MYNLITKNFISVNGTYPGSTSVSVSTRIYRVAPLVENDYRLMFALAGDTPAIRLSG
ncbi:hypothetical protein SAMN05428988_2020 [Chitinophaga sp. YR573]|nr:hypothetical protein SAMN05428988_2020 [Chitinophaga sp. YR573]